MTRIQYPRQKLGTGLIRRFQVQNIFGRSIVMTFVPMATILLLLSSTACQGYETSDSEDTSNIASIAATEANANLCREYTDMASRNTRRLNGFLVMSTEHDLDFEFQSTFLAGLVRNHVEEILAIDPARFQDADPALLTELNWLQDAIESEMQITDSSTMDDIVSIIEFSELPREERIGNTLVRGSNDEGLSEALPELCSKAGLPFPRSLRGFYTNSPYRHTPEYPSSLLGEQCRLYAAHLDVIYGQYSSAQQRGLTMYVHPIALLDAAYRFQSSVVLAQMEGLLDSAYSDSLFSSTVLDLRHNLEEMERIGEERLAEMNSAREVGATMDMLTVSAVCEIAGQDVAQAHRGVL